MFSNLKISGKLALGFGIIYLIFITLFLVIIQYMGYLSEQATVMYGHPLKVSNAVQRIDSNINKINSSIKSHAPQGSLSDINKTIRLIDMHDKMISRDFDIIQDKYKGDKKIHEDVKSVYIEWKSFRDDYFSLIKQAGKEKAATILKNKNAAINERIAESMKILKSVTHDQANEFLNETLKSKMRTFNFIYFMLIITSILVISIMVYITRSVIKPINNAITAVNEIKKGDYGKKIHLFSKDEIGDLADTINEMSVALKESYTKLEHKVEERTSELNEKNKELLNEIAERKKTERELLENEKRLSQILQGIPMPLFVIDKEHTVIHWNQACEELTGYKANDIVGTDNHSRAFYDTKRPMLADLIVNESPEEDFLKYYNNRYRKSDTIENSYMAEDFYPKLGEEGRWLFFAAAPIKDVDDNVIGAIETFQDISVRKKADEMIKNERTRFLTTLERIPAFVCLQATDYTIKYANNKFRSLFGDPEGKLCYQVMKNRDKPCEPCDTFKVFETKDLHTWEWRRNDRETYLLYDSYITDSDGTPLVIEMGVDITEQKMAESKIREYSENLEGMVKERTAEIDATNKELDEFAYIVSHDLKAPLRAISNLTQWIEQDFSDILDNEGREKIELLINRVLRMDNLIDAILKYSRSGRSNILNEEVDLNVIINDTIELISPPENIEINIAQDYPTVTGDPTRLEQVFLNLINNSIKFMDKKAGKIEINITDKDTYWQFSVSDNGPGIEEKYYDRIFKIFQTLNSRDEIESTGIGLTLVKKIVELHGGVIWVQSQPGESSTFFFTLPK